MSSLSASALASESACTLAQRPCWVPCREETSALRVGVDAVLRGGEIVDTEPANQKHKKGESQIPLEFTLVNLVAVGMKIAEVGQPGEKCPGLFRICLLYTSPSPRDS